MPRSVPGIQRVEHIMGMPIGIDVRDAEADSEAVNQVFDWFRWVDAIFSTYRPDSEISRLNSGELTMAEVHSEVRMVLDRFDALRLETDGFFELRTDHLPLPVKRVSGLVTSSGLDTSGLVKGWSVDRAAQILDSAGVQNYSINAGGDVLMRGGALPEKQWRVGIQHPLITDKVAGVVAGTNLAVATSGTYRRGNHIVNPHTGEPPSGVLSVTIVGPQLATADAYATAAFAMGEAGPDWTTRLFGYEAMIILANHTVVSTRWFPSVE